MAAVVLSSFNDHIVQHLVDKALAIVVIWPLSSHTVVNRSGLFYKSLLVCRLLEPTFLASNVTELNFYKIDHWLMIGLCLELCVFVWFQAATT